VSHPDEAADSLSVSVALCIGPGAVARFGRIMRHLAVGLVDQAIQTRFISSDPQVQALSLSPIQTMLHPTIRRPFARRQIRDLAEDLSTNPPTAVHAVSGESYRVAWTLSEALDAELVVQVTALADCDLAERLDRKPVSRWIAWSDPLVHELTGRVPVPADGVELIRPGILASHHVACFAEDGRVPTILCTAGFGREGGVEVLLEALSVLQVRGRTFQAFLLGEGPQESLLRRLVRRRGLSTLVTFAHPAGDLTQAMHHADMLVCPAPDEEFAADGLTAMGAGMAVVALSCAVSDHFVDGKTALVCRRPTSEALADSLDQLILDPVQARQLATSAQEYVRSHHAASTMAERTAAVYRSLALSRATFPLRR